MSEFESTRWSLICRVREGSEDERRRTLAEWCAAYWYPLYAFARRSGQSSADAENLTRGFFEKLLESDLFARASPACGRLRSFLLSSFKHFITNEWQRENAGKRGGGVDIVSSDMKNAAERYRREPSEGAAPDAFFERKWALEVIRRALGHVEEENGGRFELFARLRRFMAGPNMSPELEAKIGKEFSMTDNRVREVLHGLRAAFATALRREVARTLGSDGDVEEELRCLIHAVAGPALTAETIVDS
jgi:DNA-directed RNA polymerase specialized sigma24 family protein